MIEARFPINEKEITIKFTWTDAYKNKKFSRTSLYFEKANVLFNIGSVYSAAALQQSRQNDEGVKLSSHYFQCAAGAFEQLSELLQKMPQEVVCGDMNLEVLAFIKSLMLAQAQECFYEKAAKDNMKPTLLSKIAAQVSEYYFQAEGLFNTTVKNATDKNIQLYLQAMHQLYLGLARYNHSIALHEGDKYGEEVGNLRSSLTHLQEAAKLIKKASNSEASDFIKRVTETVSIASAKAERENDRIFHELVPSLNSLPSIEPLKKAMVKPIHVQVSNDANLFTKLIPFATHQASSIYDEQKAELIRQEIKMIEDHNDLAKSALVSMGLPGSIQMYESPSGVPQPLLEKLKSVSSEGGIRLLRELIEALNKLAEEDISICRSIISELDQEEADDNMNRMQLGDDWPRTPSSTLTQGLRGELSNYRTKLDQSRKSDSYVVKKYKDNQEWLEKISGTESDIIAMIPGRSASTQRFDLSRLKHMLFSLDTLLSERNSLMNSLRETASKDDVSSKLINISEGKSQESVFEEELKKYDPIKAKLRSSFSDQKNILHNIAEENTRFSSSNAGSSLSGRADTLSKMENALKVFHELKGNLREGMEFYLSLQESLRLLQGKVSDFILARDTEKADLEREIQNQQKKLHASMTNVAVASPPPSHVDSQMRSSGSHNLSSPSYQTPSSSYSSAATATPSSSAAPLPSAAAPPPPPSYFAPHQVLNSSQSSQSPSPAATHSLQYPMLSQFPVYTTPFFPSTPMVYGTQPPSPGAYYDPNTLMALQYQQMQAQAQAQAQPSNTFIPK
eukprot:TRINITY_DN3854_c0_g1_i1.p1 TRINITY_DN3854_c0_g1~~TRINITY_DN3854_c0_g1_i1.p1  ORF type:complete len:877 (+),score=270.26 TRINITY_DN3854_c0_g1_i1:258-2633(+)